MRRLVIALIALCALVAPAAAAGQDGVAAGTYVVDGVRTAADRSAVAATGAAIVEVDHGAVVVTASPSDLRRLSRLPYRVTPRTEPPAPDQRLPGREAAFPPADSGYHTYQEWVDETAAIVAAHPSLATRVQIGTSFEGRPIWALKVSDAVGSDEAEPEILLTHGLHAREHLTVEMALYMLRALTDGYAADARIRGIVDSRETWILPSVNPDGAEFDVATGSYVFWRKNRQPPLGTDLNRNWGFQWGCCGGSSPDPASETYRGPSPFSAPEAQVVRDFVQSRRIGGVQQIKAAIDFHSYGELILWPYGYTLDDVAPGLDADQYATFVAIGRSMAAANGYTPQQASDLYITDGSIDDWLWAAEGVFAFTFEMYPTGVNPGFYPADEAIAPQTARNREAVLRLLEIADCPYRAIGKQAQHCPAAAPPPPPPAPPPPPPVTPRQPAGAVVTALTSRAAVAADGRLRLRLRCRTVLVARCRGTLALKARLPGGRGRATTIVRASYDFAAGVRTMTLRLGRSARRALRRRGTLSATLTLVTRQPSRSTTSRSRRVTLVRRR